jgi:hypothetical protein
MLNLNQAALIMSDESTDHISDDAVDYLNKMNEDGNKFLDDNDLKDKLAPIIGTVANFVLTRDDAMQVGTQILCQADSIGSITAGGTATLIGILVAEGYIINKPRE